MRLAWSTTTASARFDILLLRGSAPGSDAGTDGVLVRRRVFDGAVREDPRSHTITHTGLRVEPKGLAMYTCTTWTAGSIEERVSVASVAEGPRGESSSDD